MIIVENKKIKEDENIQVINKNKNNKNNLKINAINTTINPDINNEKDYESSYRNIKIIKNYKGKNNSLSNSKSDYFEKDKIDILNSLKLENQNNLNKKENIDKNSEIKCIEIKK